MPSYRYLALRSDGSLVKGRSKSASPDELRQLLRYESLSMVHCNTVPMPMFGSVSHSQRCRSLQVFCASLQMLLGAGIPLNQSLEIMGRSGPTYLASVCDRMAKRISAGISFSRCVETERELFGRLYPRILALGESTGTLQSTLEQVSASVTWQADLQGKIVKTLAYPAIVLFATIVMIVFLMIQVVPVMREFIESVGLPVPLYSEVLFALARIVGDWWLVLFCTVFFVCVTVLVLYRLFSTYRLQVHRMVLSIPVLGPLVFTLMLARYTHVMSLLGEAGLGLVENLKSCEALENNLWFRRRLNEIGTRVTNGESLTEAMDHAQIFPEQIIRSLQVGESVGQSVMVFRHLAMHYQKEATTRAERMHQLLGPSLIAVLGAVILWVVASVMTPLYGAIAMGPYL